MIDPGQVSNDVEVVADKMKGILSRLTLNTLLSTISKSQHSNAE